LLSKHKALSSNFPILLLKTNQNPRKTVEQFYKFSKFSYLGGKIRRIVVQNQPWANSWRDPSSKKPITKKS
jgi:hypothetical protein